MRETMNPPDPLLWQRVITGDATLKEEQTVLAWCETDPHQYRELALALLEERQFASTIRTIAMEEQRSEAPANTVVHLSSVDEADSHVNSLITGRPRYWLNWILASAALVMGLLSGNVATRMSINPPPINSLASPPTIPTRDVGFGLPPLFNAEATSNLEEAGFEIEESPDVYLVQGKDGSRWFLPTQTTTVRFNKP